MKYIVGLQLNSKNFHWCFIAEIGDYDAERFSSFVENQTIFPSVSISTLVNDGLLCELD